MTKDSNFEHGGLSIRVKDEGGEAVISWQGQSDTRDPGIVLTPYLTELSEKLRGRKVVLDFRSFEYMNSATVSPLVRFVKNLDAKGAYTTLLFDLDTQWQRVNAQCMRSIARTLANVRVP